MVCERLLRLIFASLILFLLPEFLGAQTAQFTGQVTDSSHAPIVGAAVIAKNLETGIDREMATNEEGYYVGALLSRGRYTLTVRQTGFRPVVREATLDEGQSARIDFVLAVGDVQQSVEVTAEAPILDQDSAAVSSVITNKAITQLPLLNRNIIALATLTPMVRAVGNFGGLPVSSYDGGRMSIGGGPPSANSYLIDGIAAENPTSGVMTIYLPVDATEEFRVITRIPAAEYGRTGGGVVSVTSKSGTNEFHGNFYEFFRNTVLNANDWFANKNGQPRVGTHLNQFGATFGGPLIKGKTFFFTNFEGFEYRQAQAVTRTVPTLAERIGDFSGIFDAQGRQVVIYDPLTTAQTPSGTYTRTAFAGNKIPADRISPVAKAIMQYYPLPNQTGIGQTGQNNFYKQTSVQQNDRVYGLRIDHNLSATQRISGRYTYATAIAGSPEYFGLAETNASNAPLSRHSGALNYFYTLSPTLLMQANLGGNTYGQNRKTRSFGFDITSLGFPASLQNQMQIRQFPSINVTDVNSLGAGTADTIRQTAYTLTASGSLIKILHSHSLKFGTDERIYRLNNTQANIDDLGFSFSRAFTQGPNPNTAGTNLGHGVATFLLGYPTSGYGGIAAATTMQVRYFSLFAQDDWKILPTLTLNLGVRWEREGPLTDRFNAITNFNPDATTTINGRTFSGTLEYPGYSGVPRGVRDASWRDFMPRVGFAYQPFPKTVIRGGYGVYFLPTTGLFIGLGRTGYDSTTPLTTTNASVGGGFYPIANLTNPFPNGLTQPLGASGGPEAAVSGPVSATVRNLERGYSQEFGLNIQRELPASITLEIGYAGNRGVSLPGSLNMSYLPQAVRSSYSVAQLQTALPNPYCAFTQPNIVCNATIQRSQLLSTFPQFTSVTVLSSWGASTYHAMTIRAERRFGTGLSFSSSYTFSKLIDNNLGNGANNFSNGGSNSVQNPENLRAERAVSVINLPQRFVTSVFYDLPFGRRGPRFIRTALEGWQVNGILTFQSGEPIGVTTTVGNSAFAGSRPNLVGNPRPQNPSVSSWLNASAFQVAPALAYGNAPRNLPSYRTAAMKNLDMTLSKTTTLHERWKLQFRAEAINLTNTPTFGQPATGFGAANFGVVTSTVSIPRNLQLALKLQY